LAIARHRRGEVDAAAPAPAGEGEPIRLNAAADIENYKEILRKDPNNLQALIGIGNLYFDTNRDLLAIENYLLKGKTNIVDFYSDYCPPCKKISPLLQKLGGKRPDLAILQVDINRKGVKGIDWASPLARQYELSSIPHFKIYDGDGNLLKEGQEAWPEIFALLAAAGIRE